MAASARRAPSGRFRFLRSTTIVSQPYHDLVDHAPSFRCTVKVHGTSRIVDVEGEIDLFTVSQLRRAIGEAFRAHPEMLVIDLASVTFMDSSGLHALLDAHRRSHADGLRLVIVPAPDIVEHPFRLAGLDGCLPFVPKATPNGRSADRR